MRTDCGIHRTAKANPCRLPAPGIRFQDGPPSETAFPGKDAPAGFPESWRVLHPFSGAIAKYGRVGSKMRGHFENQEG